MPSQRLGDIRSSGKSMGRQKALSSPPPPSSCSESLGRSACVAGLERGMRGEWFNGCTLAVQAGDQGKVIASISHKLL